TRSLALLVKPTELRSPLKVGPCESLLPLAVPALFTLTSCVAGAAPCQLRTNTSPAPDPAALPSTKPATRSVARLSKATLVPSGLMAGKSEESLPPAPAVLTLISVVVGVADSQSRTKTLLLKPGGMTLAVRSVAKL